MAWVAGGGKFGLRAAGLLSARGMQVRVIEKDLRRCALLEELGFRVECADAVELLADRLLSSATSLSWVVAAVPLHLAFEWLKKSLSPVVELRRSSPPELLIPLLPHASIASSGDIHASWADFLCPVDCREGPNCAVTGRPRPESLYRRIAGLDLAGVNILVVRSYQLAAGVGGIRAADLKKARNLILSREGPFLLATSCKCHAVITSFEKSIS